MSTPNPNFDGHQTIGNFNDNDSTAAATTGNFLPEIYSKQTINQALSFTRNLMLNKFYLPNNLYIPRSRIVFENCFS